MEPLSEETFLVILRAALKSKNLIAIRYSARVNEVATLPNTSARKVLSDLKEADSLGKAHAICREALRKATCPT
jgi:hypothetical protein